MNIICTSEDSSVQIIFHITQHCEINHFSPFFFVAARLQAVTEWLGFSAKELPSSAQVSIQALAGIAEALEIKDCSDTCFCLALSDLCQRRARDIVKRGQLIRDIDGAQEQIRRTLIKQANQRRLVNQVDSLCMEKDVL